MVGFNDGEVLQNSVSTQYDQAMLTHQSQVEPSPFVGNCLLD